MNLHEYQAKVLFSRYGIPVPEGVLAASANEAVKLSTPWCDSGCVVKAQVHAGGRGKAGGVELVTGADAVREATARMLDARLVTGQSGAAGQPVELILLEKPVSFDRELYISLLLDRSTESLMFVASLAGGMDIEQVAQQHPEQIHTVHVDPVAGFQAFHSRQLGFALRLDGQLRALYQVMSGMYRMFTERDLSLVEVNPLVVSGEGKLVALDAKINVDDSAMYRQTELAEWRDPAQEDPREYAAQQHGLNYVPLDGSIGCMVNGAGLAMATMDIIKLHGGEPANFLDVGGGTSADKVAEAFKLILEDSRVRAILVNIFGGIVRCDLIAEGIVNAVRDVGLNIPVIVRLQGTNMQQGRALLDESGLAIVTAEDLNDAAGKAVAAARGTG